MELVVQATSDIAQKIVSSIKDFFSKLDQSPGNCGFGHFYWTNPQWKLHFFGSALQI